MSETHKHVEEPGPSEVRSPLVQQELKRAGVWFGLAIAIALTALLAQPLREFGRRLFRLRGYRDGLTGLLLAALMAEHEWHVQRRLRVLRKGAARA